MPLQSGSTDGYSPVAKFLHWVVAAGVFGMVPVGLYMVWRGAATDFDATTNTLYSTHKLIGFTLLWIILIRVVYRLRIGAPAPAATLTRFERIASTTVHHLLYVLLVAVPIMGWLGVSAYGARDVFGLFSIPPLLADNQELGEALLKVHRNLAIVLATFVAVHICGALMHGLIKQDGVINRMIGWWPLRK
ncbi:MAG: cytochrome b [Beijerinckiaceae bacterium]